MNASSNGHCRHLLTLLCAAAMVTHGGCMSHTGTSGPQPAPTVPLSSHVKASPSYTWTTARQHAVFKPPPVLTEKIDVDFADTKLIDAVQQLRDQSGLSIVMDWFELEAAGVEQDFPISFSARRLPVYRVLQLMVEQMDAGDQLEPIGFNVTDRVVTITSHRQLIRSPREVRIFDVRDLLDVPFAANHIGQWRALFPERVAHYAKNGADKRRMLPTREEVTVQIVNCVQDTIGGDTWYRSLYSLSSLRIFNPLLDIRTHAANHERIAVLLGAIRRQQHEHTMQLYRDAEIARLLTEANRLRLEGRFTESRQWLNRAADVQPDHPVVEAMRRALDQLEAIEMSTTHP